MTRLQTLALLHDREQGRRDQAQVALRNAGIAAEAAQAQLDSLVQYRTEYHLRWQAEFGRGARMEIVRCYHAFIDRLDQAIQQQQGAVRIARSGVDGARKLLVACEVRVATVDKLMQRRRELLARAAERREIKDLDEMAQRRSAAAEPAAFD